jgi:molybdopterin converting factor small subunit
MRRHVRFFVNDRQTFDLAQPLADGDELLIVQALSGG